MSSDFDDFLTEGFEAMLEQTGAEVVGPNGQAANCVPGPLLRSKQLRASGLMPEIESTIEIFRTDAQRIGILDGEGAPVDRAQVQMSNAVFQCMLVEDDPADPAIRVHLKRYRGK